MKRALLILWFLLPSCGFNGEQKLTISDSNQTISVYFKFIQQIKDLCTAQTLRSNYESEELYNKAVADCTFANLSLINLQQLQQLQDECKKDHLTPDEQTACAAIGGH